MNAKFFAVVWVLVLAVTSYDIYFAIQYAEVIEEWESNVCALEIINNLGFCWAIVFRAFTVLAALVIISVAPVRTKWVGSGVLLLIHLYLAGVYFLILIP